MLERASAQVSLFGEAGFDRVTTRRDFTGIERVVDRVLFDEAVKAVAAEGRSHQEVTSATQSAPATVDADESVTLQVGSFGEGDNARRLSERLRDAGVDDVDIDHVELDGRDLWRVRVGPVLNHDESEAQVSATVHPGVYVRSFYFFDPDGITLEFACWTKEFTDSDTTTEPKTAADRRPRVGV